LSVFLQGQQFSFALSSRNKSKKKNPPILLAGMLTFASTPVI